MDLLQGFLSHLDGFAGLAAFVNGLILWPIVRGQKADHRVSLRRLDNHEDRLAKLEPK